MAKKPTQKEIDNWNRIRAKGVKKYQEKKKKPVVLKKVPIKKKIYKINSRSKKQSQREAEYNKLIKELKKIPENQVCCAKWEGCTGGGDTVHHAKGRIGKYLLMKEFFRFVCLNCHILIELYPDRAKKDGLSFSRLIK